MIKDAVEAINLVNDAVERMKNADAIQAMALVKMDRAKLTERVATLEAQIVALEQKEKLSAEVFIRDDVFWRRLPDGREEGPFCPACWQGEKERLVNLLGGNEYKWGQCSVSKEVWWKPGGREKWDAREAELRSRPTARSGWVSGALHPSRRWP